MQAEEARERGERRIDEEAEQQAPNERRRHAALVSEHQLRASNSEFLEGVIEPETTKAYEASLLKFMLFMKMRFDNTSLRDVTQDHVVFFIRDLHEAGLSSSTVKQYVTGIGHFTQDVGKGRPSEWPDVQKALKVTRKRSKRAQPPEFPLDTLWNTLAADPIGERPLEEWTVLQLRNRCILLIAITKGWRPSDIAGIVYGSARRYLDVDGKPCVKIDMEDVKATKMRTVTRMTHVIHYNDGHPHMCPATTLLTYKARSASDVYAHRSTAVVGNDKSAKFLFVKDRGSNGQLSADRVSTVIRDASAAAGINTVVHKPYGVRRAVVTRLIGYMKNAELMHNFHWQSIETALKHYVQAGIACNTSAIMQAQFDRRANNVEASRVAR